MADVPVFQNDASIIVEATSNGQVLYDFDFLAFEADHLRVRDLKTGLILLGSDGDFTASGLGDENGGSIDLTPAGLTILDGDEFLIYRQIPIARLADYSIEFRAETINRELDTLFMIAQELRREVDQSFKVSPGASAGEVYPGAAGELAMFDADGNLVSSGENITSILGSTEAAEDAAQAALLLRNQAQTARDEAVAAANSMVIKDYASRATAIAATIGATATHVRTAGYYSEGDGGDALYVKAVSQPAHAGKFQSADGAWWELVVDDINVKQFGARAGANSAYSAGNTVAFQAAHDFAVARGLRNNVIFIPAGDYYIGDEINVFASTSPRIDIIFEGAGTAATRILSDFFGAGKALFKGKDAARLLRCSPRWFRNLYLGTVTRTGGVNPKMIDIFGWGTSSVVEVFFGPSNNTHMAAGGIQDVYFSGCHSYYGGCGWRYKDTDALTFDITGSGTDRTITASGSIFTTATPNDVGKMLTTVPAGGGTRIMWEIIAVINGTTATVRCTTGAANMTGGKAYFQGAVGSMVAAGSTLSADVAFATSDDVGKIVYVAGAKAGAGGRGFLRAYIGSVAGDGKSVGLIDEFGAAATATYTVTDVPFATPVMDIFYVPGSTNACSVISTNNEFIGFNVNDYLGVALCFLGIQQFKMLSCVFEGAISPLSSKDLPAGQIWGDNVSGRISGDFGTHAGFFKEANRFSANTKALFLDAIEFRNFVGQQVFANLPAISTGDGAVIINGFSVINEVDDVENLLVDANTTRRMLFAGVVAVKGKSLEERVFGHKIAQGGLILQPMAAGNIANGALGISQSTGRLNHRSAAGVLSQFAAVSGGGWDIIVGTGAPGGTVSATKGTLFVRQDGSSASTRLYINTDGATAWTNLTTAA